MISVKTHNIENRFVTGPESVPFCRLVRALFSPEILQAVAVKGLRPSTIENQELTNVLRLKSLE